MAVFTSKATGNWSASGQTTWTQVGVPGNGDTVTIQDTHVITVDVNTTVGSSPASGGTTAIAVTGTTGKLIIETGITLICRGDLRLNNAPFTMNAGATLEFDASAASSPSSQHYLFYAGDGGYNNNCIVTITGTSGSRCTIRSNAGGGTAAITAQSFARWHGTIRYTDFSRMGSASVPAIQAGATGGTFDLEQCVFDGCGKLEVLNATATNVLRVVNVTTKNTTDATYAMSGNGSAASLTSGTRLIQDCVFDKQVESSFRDTTILGTVFTGDGPFSVLSERVWAAFTGNLVVWIGTGQCTTYGSIADSYCLHTYTGINPHYLIANGTLTISGCIFELTGTDGNGDAVQVGSAAAPITVTLTHNLGLPNGGGDDAGTLLTQGGNSNVTASMTHNTWFCGTQACAGVGETYAGHAGLLAAFTNNLVWDTSARGYKISDVSSSVNDLISAANAHHNAGYNLLTGSNLKGYHNLDFSSGSPGASDVDGTNPTFVDSDRDLAKWDLSLGGAGTVASALTNLRLKNEAGYNTNYTIAALIAYVKAGFVPQAAALQAASDSVAPSNGWIGAVQGATASAGGASAGLAAARAARWRNRMMLEDG